MAIVDSKILSVNLSLWKQRAKKIFEINWIWEKGVKKKVEIKDTEPIDSRRLWAASWSA